MSAYLLCHPCSLNQGRCDITVNQLKIITGSWRCGSLVVSGSEKKKGFPRLLDKTNLKPRRCIKHMYIVIESKELVKF